MRWRDETQLSLFALRWKANLPYSWRPASMITVYLYLCELDAEVTGSILH